MRKWKQQRWTVLPEVWKGKEEEIFGTSQGKGMEDPGKTSWMDFLLSVGKPQYREELGAARGRSKHKGQESPTGSLAKQNPEHKEKVSVFLGTWKEDTENDTKPY